LSPIKPITNVNEARLAATIQGRIYGCSSKRVIPPKTSGHLVAGLLRTPPIIGLQNLLAVQPEDPSDETYAIVLPALHMSGIRAKASPTLVESVN